MGILGFIKSQLIDIIEWTDDTNYTLVHRFPDDDHEVKNGAKLICRENQAAILINEGQLADIFGPGTHTLSTQNVPILSTLKGWKYGFSSPFKVDVYFVNLKQYLDQKWGTSNPVLIRDPEFAVGNRPGRVRIRAFGSYNFKISEPGAFFKEVVGTQGITTTDAIEGYLRRLLVSRFTQAAGRAKVPVADLAGQYNLLEDAVKDELKKEFEKLGLSLTTFIIENISLPAEIEKALDAAAAQSARGVDNTLAWEGMQAMRDAARKGGGGNPMMQAGMGMGMGAGMGQMMGNVMGQAMQQPQQGYPPPGYGYPPPGYPPPPGYGHPQQHPQQYQQHPQHQGPPQQQPPPQQAAPPANTLESKLRKLKAAFEAGLLDDSEYKAKKMALLDSF